MLVEPRVRHTHCLARNLTLSRGETDDREDGRRGQQKRPHLRSRGAWAGEWTSTGTHVHKHTQATSEQTCKTDTGNTLPTHACSDIVIWFNITGVESALDHELEWNAGMDIVQNLKIALDHELEWNAGMDIVQNLKIALDHELEWNAGMDIVQNLKHYMLTWWNAAHRQALLRLSNEGNHLRSKDVTDWPPSQLKRERGQATTDEGPTGHRIS